MNGCATYELRENMRTSSYLYTHKIAASQIQEGQCTLTAHRIQMDYNNGTDAYRVDLLGSNVFLDISENGTEASFKFSDTSRKILTSSDAKDLTIIFSRHAANQVELRDLDGPNPIAFVQIERREWEHQGDSLIGTAYYVKNHRLAHAKVVQIFSPGFENSIVQGIKGLCYLVTVPFDIVTFPIQAVVIIRGLDHAMKGVH